MTWAQKNGLRGVCESRRALQLRRDRMQGIHSTVVEDIGVRDERSSGSPEGRGVHVKLVVNAAGGGAGRSDRHDPLYG